MVVGFGDELQTYKVFQLYFQLDECGRLNDEKRMLWR